MYASHRFSSGVISLGGSLAKLTTNTKRGVVSDSTLAGFLTQHGLHNPDLSALATIDIRREIEEFGILPRAGSVEQVFHHNQGAVVVLNHPGQKQLVELCSLSFLQRCH